MADRNENIGSYGSSLVIFLLGAAVGATVAILYAPMTGAETRAQIVDKAGTLKEKATDLKEQVVEKATQWKDAATEKLSTMAHKETPGDAARVSADGASEIGRPADSVPG
jgi:Gas vesicle protein